MADDRTPNMDLNLPNIGSQQEGGDSFQSASEKINEALRKIDEHDHGNGKGKGVPTSSLIADEDITMNEKDIKQVNQVTLLNTNKINEIKNFSFYFLNNDLYVKDGLGNTVRLTKGGDIVPAELTAGSLTLRESVAITNVQLDNGVLSFSLKNLETGTLIETLRFNVSGGGDSGGGQGAYSGVGFPGSTETQLPNYSFYVNLINRELFFKFQGRWVSLRPTADDISTDSSVFGKNLSSNDDTVQRALETIDQIIFENNTSGLLSFSSGVKLPTDSKNGTLFYLTAEQTLNGITYFPGLYARVFNVWRFLGKENNDVSIGTGNVFPLSPQDDFWYLTAVEGENQPGLYYYYGGKWHNIGRQDVVTDIDTTVDHNLKVTKADGTVDEVNMRPFIAAYSSNWALLNDTSLIPASKLANSFIRLATNQNLDLDFANGIYIYCAENDGSFTGLNAPTDLDVSKTFILFRHRSDVSNICQFIWQPEGNKRWQKSGQSLSGTLWVEASGGMGGGATLTNTDLDVADPSAESESVGATRKVIAQAILDNKGSGGGSATITNVPINIDSPSSESETIGASRQSIATAIVNETQNQLSSDQLTILNSFDVNRKLISGGGVRQPIGDLDIRNAVTENYNLVNKIKINGNFLYFIEWRYNSTTRMESLNCIEYNIRTHEKRTINLGNFDASNSLNPSVIFHINKFDFAVDDTTIYLCLYEDVSGDSYLIIKAFNKSDGSEDTSKGLSKDQLDIEESAYVILNPFSPLIDIHGNNLYITKTNIASNFRNTNYHIRVFNLVTKLEVTTLNWIQSELPNRGLGNIMRCYGITIYDDKLYILWRQNNLSHIFSYNISDKSNNQDDSYKVRNIFSFDFTNKFLYTLDDLVQYQQYNVYTYSLNGSSGSIIESITSHNIIDVSESLGEKAEDIVNNISTTENIGFSDVSAGNSENLLSTTVSSIRDRGKSVIYGNYLYTLTRSNNSLILKKSPLNNLASSETIGTIIAQSFRSTLLNIFIYNKKLCAVINWNFYSYFGNYTGSQLQVYLNIFDFESNTLASNLHWVPIKDRVLSGSVYNNYYAYIFQNKVYFGNSRNLSVFNLDTEHFDNDLVLPVSRLDPASSLVSFIVTDNNVFYIQKDKGIGLIVNNYNRSTDTVSVINLPSISYNSSIQGNFLRDNSIHYDPVSHKIYVIQPLTKSYNIYEINLTDEEIDLESLILSERFSLVNIKPSKLPSSLLHNSPKRVDSLPDLGLEGEEVYLTTDDEDNVAGKYKYTSSNWVLVKVLSPRRVDSLPDLGLEGEEIYLTTDDGDNVAGKYKYTSSNWVLVKPLNFPGVTVDFTKKQRLISEQLDSPAVPEERGEVTFASTNTERIYLRQAGYGGTKTQVNTIEFKFKTLQNNALQWSSSHNDSTVANAGSVDGEITNAIGPIISILASGSPFVNWASNAGIDVSIIYDVINDEIYRLTGSISTPNSRVKSRAIPSGLVSAIQTATNSNLPIKLKIIYSNGSEAGVLKKVTSEDSEIFSIFPASGMPSGWGSTGWHIHASWSPPIGVIKEKTPVASDGTVDSKFGSLRLLSDQYIGIISGGSRVVRIQDHVNNRTHLVATGWTTDSPSGLDWTSIPSSIAPDISRGAEIRLEITYADGTKLKVTKNTEIPALGTISDNLKGHPIQQISKDTNGHILIIVADRSDSITKIDLDDKEINLVAYVWSEGPAGYYHVRFNAESFVYHLLNPFLVYDSSHKFSIHTANKSYGFVKLIEEVHSIKQFDAGGLAIIAKNSEIIPALGKTSLSLTLSDQASGDEGEYRTADTYNGIGAIGHCDSPQYLQAFNENSMVIHKSIYVREFLDPTNPVEKILLGSHTYTLHNLRVALSAHLGFNGQGERDIAPFGAFIRFSFDSLSLSGFGTKQDFKLEKRNKSLVKFNIIRSESTNIYSNVEVFGAVNGRPPESFNDIVRPGIFHYSEGGEYTDGPDGLGKKSYQGILQSVYLESGGFQIGKAKTSAIVDPVAATAEVYFFSPTVDTKEGITQDLHHGNILIRYEDVNIPFFLRVKNGTNETSDLYIPDVFADLIVGSGQTVKVTVKIGNKTVVRTINLDGQASTTGSLTDVKLNGLNVTKVYRSALSVQGDGAWPSPSAKGEYDDVEVTMEWTPNNIASGIFAKQTGLLHYWVSEKQKISKRFQVGSEGSFEKINSDWELVKPSEGNKIIVKQVNEIPGDDGPKMVHLVAKNSTNEEGIYIKHTTGTNGADFSYSRLESLFSNDSIPPTHKVRYSLPDNPVNNETFKAGADIFESEERRPAVTITCGDGSSGDTVRTGYRSDELNSPSYGSIIQDPDKKLGQAYTFSYRGGAKVTLIVVKESELPSDGSGGHKDLTSLRMKTPTIHVYGLDRRDDVTGADNATVFRSYAVENTGGINLFPVGQKVPIDLRASGDLLWPDLHFEAGKIYRYNSTTQLWSEVT